MERIARGSAVGIAFILALAVIMARVSAGLHSLQKAGSRNSCLQ